MEGSRSSLSIVGTLFSGVIYSYYVVSRLPKGFLRILVLIPVIGMYMIFPLQLSTVHMRGILSFMFTWICSFKLLMLSFDVGPLSNPWAKHSLIHFIAVAAFPVEIQECNPKSPSDTEATSKKFAIMENLVLKGCLLGLIIHSYKFRIWLPQGLILVIYGVHMYLALDILLVSLAILANSFLGVQLKPQFDKPYLSSSLGEFWGKRWNLIVTNILRPSVYGPVLDLCWKMHRRLCGSAKRDKEKEVRPPLWARGVAVICAFLVSGLMHELIFWYLTEREPSWEVTAFFTLHGLAVAMESCLKRKLPSFFTLPKFLAVPFTLAIVYTTGYLLFFPPVTRYGTDIKTIAEYYALFEYLLSLSTQCWKGF